MKNFKKRILAAAVAVIMASALTVGAAAQSYTYVYGGSCSGSTNSNGSVSASCPSGTDLNALLGSLSSKICGTQASTTPDCVKSNSACQSSNRTACGKTAQARSAPVKQSTCPSSANLSGILASLGTKASASKNSCGSTSTAAPSVTASAAPGAVPSATPTPTETSETVKADSLAFEQQVAALVNQQRAANGLSPLTLSAELSDVARLKSQDMHDNKYFAHDSPTYGSPFDMLSSFGISYRAAGENIAIGYATPEAVVNAWMNSPGHRANILNPSYTQLGVGYVADGSYWTQEFIG